jgi:hypothetical protein
MTQKKMVHAVAGRDRGKARQEIGDFVKQCYKRKREKIRRAE